MWNTYVMVVNISTRTFSSFVTSLVLIEISSCFSLTFVILSASTLITKFSETVFSFGMKVLTEFQNNLFVSLLSALAIFTKHFLFVFLVNELHIWNKVFKMGPSKIWRRPPLKGYGLPKTSHITSNFLKIVFHKFYLVHSWRLCHICLTEFWIRLFFCLFYCLYIPQFIIYTDFYIGFQIQVISCSSRVCFQFLYNSNF